MLLRLLLPAGNAGAKGERSADSNSRCSFVSWRVLHRHHWLAQRSHSIRGRVCLLCVPCNLHGASTQAYLVDVEAQPQPPADSTAPRGSAQHRAAQGLCSVSCSRTDQAPCPVLSSKMPAAYCAGAHRRCGAGCKEPGEGLDTDRAPEHHELAAAA